MSKKNNLLSAFSWLTSGRILNILIQLVIVAFLSRLLVPADFGIMGIALSIVGIANLITEIGFGQSIIQVKNLTHLHTRTAFTFTFIIGLVLMFVLLIASKWIANFFEISGVEDVLMLLSPLFLLESIKTVGISVMQKKMDFKYYAVTQLISHFIGYGILSIILAYNGFGVYSLVFGNLASGIIQLFYIVKYDYKLFKFGFSKSAFNDLFKFSSWYSLARFSNYAAGNFDNLLIGKLLGADSLGLYTRGFVVMVKPVNLLGGTLQKVLFPAMSKETEVERKKIIFLEIIEAICFISLPLSLGMFLFADILVLIVFGKDWIEIIPLIKVLIVAIPFRILSKILEASYKSSGKVRFLFVLQLIYAVSVVAFVALLHKFGLQIVAMGIVCSVILNTVLLLFFNQPLLNLRISEYLIKTKFGIRVSILISITFLLLKIILNDVQLNFSKSYVILICIFLINVPIIYYFKNYFIPKRLLKIKIRK